MDFIKGFLEKIVHVKVEPTIAAAEEVMKALSRLGRELKDSVVSAEIESFREHLKFVDDAFKKCLWFAEKLLMHLTGLETEWNKMNRSKTD